MTDSQDSDYNARMETHHDWVAVAPSDDVPEELEKAMYQHLARYSSATGVDIPIIAVDAAKALWHEGLLLSAKCAGCGHWGLTVQDEPKYVRRMVQLMSSLPKPEGDDREAFAKAVLEAAIREGRCAELIDHIGRGGMVGLGGITGQLRLVDQEETEIVIIAIDPRDFL